MKKTAFLVLALVLGLSVVPAVAASPKADQAIRLSAPNSGASIEAICQAVYEAVEQSPEDAQEIFRGVLAQRDTWTSVQCYCILRSVLLIRPDISSNLLEFVLGANPNLKDSVLEGALSMATSAIGKNDIMVTDPGADVNTNSEEPSENTILPAAPDTSYDK